MADATNGWSRAFDDPIELPGGKKLVTLKDAIDHLSKVVPKSDHDHPKVLIAATRLRRMLLKVATSSCVLASRHCGRSTGMWNGCSIRTARKLTGASAS